MFLFPGMFSHRTASFQNCSHPSSSSSLSDAQRNSLDEARKNYEVPLPADLGQGHAENQQRVAQAIGAWFDAQPGVVFAQDRPARLAEHLYTLLKEARFNPDVYLPRDAHHPMGYGKYLLYTDDNAGLPYCLQVFAFSGGQKTPIHDHPCECTSVVFQGTLKERLYRALPDGTAFKYAKRHRAAGSTEALHPNVPNIHSLKNNSQEAGAVSVHLYRLDGVGAPAAVQSVYRPPAKADDTPRVRQN
ncbi:MAG: hypothetical protein RIR70_1072 [Pseudomonadota bacterium]|jgi:predicted metal-dependent enzyme (double-stranded beta helix superfamily)